MNTGTTSKRCYCRDRNTGKPLGAKCPKLRRGNTWNQHHGVWQYQIELPKAADGRRRPLRRGPFDNQTDAGDVFHQPCLAQHFEGCGVSGRRARIFLRRGTRFEQADPQTAPPQQQGAKEPHRSAAGNQHQIVRPHRNRCPPVAPARMLRSCLGS